MNIHLTEHFEKLIDAKVKSGHYSSASEVVREALRLLEEQDQMRHIKLEALKKEIQLGLESGPSVPFDAEKIKKRARQLVRNKRNG